MQQWFSYLASIKFYNYMVTNKQYGRSMHVEIMWIWLIRVTGGFHMYTNLIPLSYAAMRICILTSCKQMELKKDITKCWMWGIYLVNVNKKLNLHISILWASYLYGMCHMRKGVFSQTIAHYLLQLWQVSFTWLSHINKRNGGNHHVNDGYNSHHLH